MAVKKVEITSGPHGNNTTIVIDGQKIEGAREFVLSATSDGATTLTITYPVVEAVVDGMVETWAFNSKTKTYLAPKPDDVPAVVEADPDWLEDE